MRKLTVLMALIALASVAFSGTASYAAGSQIQLKALNGSGEDGTATFSDPGGGKLKVTVEVKGGTAEPQPAYIHKGTCANIQPQIEYPLTSVSDGKSETTLAVSLDDLQKTDYAVAIHKSTADLGTYVSCGDIKGVSMSASGDTGSSSSPTATGSSGSTTSGTTSGTTSATTSGSGNTSSGSTTSGSASSGNTTAGASPDTSSSSGSTTSSGSGNTSNMPVTGVGDDPLPIVIVLLCVGLAAFVIGRKFTRREPEIL